MATIAAGLALLALEAGGAASPAEVDRLVELLELRPGSRIADVGAGDGEWAVELARRVGPEGRVWATEVDPDLVVEIAELAAREEVDNLSTVLGDARDAGLPEGCCEAVLLRMVYHHFTDPGEMRRSLRRALAPGGRLAVVDIVPQRHWRALPGVPQRGGHGIHPDALIADLEGDGFALLSLHREWNGDPDRYCALFAVE